MKKFLNEWQKFEKKVLKETEEYNTDKTIYHALDDLEYNLQKHGRGKMYYEGDFYPVYDLPAKKGDVSIEVDPDSETISVKDTGVYKIPLKDKVVIVKSEPVRNVEGNVEEAVSPGYDWDQDGEVHSDDKYDEDWPPDSSAGMTISGYSGYSE